MSKQRMWSRADHGARRRARYRLLGGSWAPDLDVSQTDVEILDKIMSEIESDPEIDPKAISLDVLSQGFIKKREILKMNGIVDSAGEKDRMLQIARMQMGYRCDIADKLVVD